MFAAVDVIHKMFNIVQSNTTIINILFIGLGRHVSIPLESSSDPSTKTQRDSKRWTQFRTKCGNTVFHSILG